jgi:peroxiredoxin
MDTNKPTELSLWVDERMSKLDLDNNWQPDTSAGLARLKSMRHPSVNWFSKRWVWTVATAAGVFLFAISLPSPQVLAHKCLECSVAVWQSLASNSSQATLTPERDRKAAADFSLKGANGEDVRLSDLKGKVVLVNFWATWCEGCQVEIPWFVEFQSKYGGRGLNVVGISMDDDGWKSVKPWIKEKKVNYSVVIGSEGLAKQYGLGGMPLTVLVDARGRIAVVHAGILNKAETENNIRALLEEIPNVPTTRASGGL